MPPNISVGNSNPELLLHTHGKGTLESLTRSKIFMYHVLPCSLAPTTSMSFLDDTQIYKVWVWVCQGEQGRRDEGEVKGEGG